MKILVLLLMLSANAYALSPPTQLDTWALMALKDYYTTAPIKTVKELKRGKVYLINGKHVLGHLAPTATKNVKAVSETLGLAEAPHHYRLPTYLKTRGVKRGGRTYTLTQYLVGETLSPGVLTEEQLYVAGRALGALHKELANTPTERLEGREVSVVLSERIDLLTSDERLWPKGSPEAQLIEVLVNFKEEYMDFIESAKTQIVHGDYHAGNIVFGPEPLGIIDFEHMHVDSKFLDIAIFFNAQDFGVEVPFSVMGPFLEGYSSFAPILPKDYQMLKVLMMLNCLTRSTSSMARSGHINGEAVALNLSRLDKLRSSDFSFSDDKHQTGGE